MFEKHEVKMETHIDEIDEYKLYNPEGNVVKEGVLTKTFISDSEQGPQFKVTVSVNDPDQKNSSGNLFERVESVNIGDIKSINTAIEKLVKWLEETFNSVI